MDTPPCLLAIFRKENKFFDFMFHRSKILLLRVTSIRMEGRNKNGGGASPECVSIHLNSLLIQLTLVISTSVISNNR